MPEAICAALLFPPSLPCPFTFLFPPSLPIDLIYRYRGRQGDAFSADCCLYKRRLCFTRVDWKRTPFYRVRLLLFFFASCVVSLFILSRCHWLLCGQIGGVCVNLGSLFSVCVCACVWGRGGDGYALLTQELVEAPLGLTVNPVCACTHTNKHYSVCSVQLLSNFLTGLIFPMTEVGLHNKLGHLPHLSLLQDPSALEPN